MCKPCQSIYNRNYREANKDKAKITNRNSYLSRQEERKEYARNYTKLNREKISENKKKYHIENRDRIIQYKTIYHRHMYKNDTNFKLKDIVRSRLNTALRSKGWRKSTHFHEYIGCSQDKLKLHIEKQFTEGMNWDNWTLKGWHIDHIIPLSSAKTEEEMCKLCHYTNLQPLWALDNIRKGNR